MHVFIRTCSCVWAYVHAVMYVRTHVHMHMYICRTWVGLVLLESPTIHEMDEGTTYVCMYVHNFIYWCVCAIRICMYGRICHIGTSMTQTCGLLPLSSTGHMDVRWIHSQMASVMWGITTRWDNHSWHIHKTIMVKYCTYSTYSK